jgi:hypothetical protein
MICVFLSDMKWHVNMFCLKLGEIDTKAHIMLGIIYGHEAVSCMYVLK